VGKINGIFSVPVTAGLLPETKRPAILQEINPFKQYSLLKELIFQIIESSQPYIFTSSISAENDVVSNGNFPLDYPFA